MTETYTFVLRGGIVPPNRISGNSAEGVYQCDWLSVIPKKYNKFRMTTTFRTSPNDAFTVDDDECVYVECTAFPRQYFFDSKNNSSSNLVAIAPMRIFVNSGDRYYHETMPNNPPITVVYPTENTFCVKLCGRDGDLVTSARYVNWTLTFNLEPIVHARGTHGTD